MPFSLVHEIPFVEPLKLFTAFEGELGSIFLDSALQQGELSRFSYIAADPFMMLQRDSISENNPFDSLADLLRKYTLEALPGLPLFQGGVAGYFGYELFQYLETIPLAKLNDMQFPEMMLGFYDVVIAFDHQEKKAWIFSSGFPELDAERRIQRAGERLNYFLEKLQLRRQHALFQSAEADISLDASISFEATMSPEANISPESSLSTVSCQQASSRHPENINPVLIQPHFTKETYCQAVQKVIEYILAGDIFQANLTQRFTAELPEDYNHFELYKRLREINPATFSAYVNFGQTKLISASPERFIKLENRAVETRPIKGTRKRGKTAEEDQRIAQELLASPKDNAENVMIVDLLRNDLSRVCEPGSVTVPQLCGLESFATVHHLVSVVHGKLKSQYDAIDLLRATFPGGSITGAPKIRAMEIISELEPNHRGPYCGSIGYISWDGNMDTSITIRTLCIRGNTASFQVGGAIVADSQPEEEYEETLLKGRALVSALVGVS